MMGLQPSVDDTTHAFLQLVLNKTYIIGLAFRCKGIGTDLSLLANHKWRFQASYTTNRPGM
jgi:hypothetical protein